RQSSRRRKLAVDRTKDGNAGLRKFHCEGPAEAVADDGELIRIDPRIAAQHIEACIGSRAQERSVLVVDVRQVHGLQPWLRRGARGHPSFRRATVSTTG